MASPTTDRRQGLVGNVAMKAPVTVLAASNITLSGQQTIDGEAVLASNAAGVPDRVLCVGQNDGTQNGIWDVSTSGWSRSKDANGNYDLSQGSTVLVNRGTTYAGTYWKLDTTGSITIGTTSQSWSRALASALSTLSFLQAGTGAVARGAQDKMREWVSVTDFGAVADYTGSVGTNSTAAIQAAIDSTKSTGANYGKAVLFPDSSPNFGYGFTNLTLHSGCHLIGMGSHRTNLIRYAGSTGAALTDEGNPNKIICEGFAINMNGTAGDGIDFLGDESNNVFGSEAWMNDIYVVRSSSASNFQTGTGIKAHFNASSLGFVRTFGFATNFEIRGSLCLAPYLIASNGDVNYKVVGVGHKIGLAYSESAVTTHVQFGDASVSTQSCEVGHLAAHLLGSATTPQVIHQTASGTNTQLNRVLSGSVNFRTGSILTNLVNSDSTNFVEDITFQLTTNTHAGFFSWNPDKRDNQKLKVCGDADYSCQAFEPYAVYVFEGLTAARNFRLPLVQHGYGRQFIVKNNDSASAVTLRPNATDGSNLYNRTSTATNNLLIPPGGAVTVEGSRSGRWYVVDNQAEYLVETTYDPANMAAGTGTESSSVAVTGAAFGDFVDISAPYSLQGCQCTGYVHSSGNVRIALFNPTGGAIDLASGTWTIRLIKKA